MWQELIVAAVVLCAAVYALWQWLPAPMRSRMGWAKRWLGKGSGCSACGDCGGCASKPRTADADAAPMRWMPPSR